MPVPVNWHNLRNSDRLQQPGTRNESMQAHDDNQFEIQFLEIALGEIGIDKLNFQKTSSEVKRLSDAASPCLSSTSSSGAQTCSPCWIDSNRASGEDQERPQECQRDSTSGKTT
jgi:hypothetical protein